MNAFFYDSWTLILKFLIPGIFLGAVYDIFRLFRIARSENTYSARKEIRKRFFPKSEGEGKNPRRRITDTAIVFMEDILFFLIVAVTEILAVYHINEGEIRIYCLLASALGFFTYQKTLGRLIIFFSKKILYLIRKIVYCIACAILVPAFFISRYIGKMFSAIKRKKKNKKEMIQP